MQKAISHEGFKAIDDIKILKKAVQDIKKNGRFGITVHLSSGKPMDADMLGLAIALDERRAFYIPIVRVEGKGAGETMELFGPKEASFGAKVPEILNVLKEVFEDEKFMAAGHDLNLMLTFFKRFGIEFKCRLADAMVESYVLNPGESHEIEFLTEKYLGCKVTGLDEIAGKEKEQIPTEAACGYYCERASAVLSLSALFGDKMREGGFLDLYEKLEEPVIRVLAGMQFAGVKVDIQKLEAQGKVINGKLGKLEEKIYVLAGEKFNINSPRQLGEILFGKMKLPGAKKTKTGFSTSQDILEDLSIKHELPAIILDYRTLSKLKSTYIDALPLIVTKETCRIHTSFNQAVAATGRLTSSDPNLQNIPIRAEEGRKIREAFVAEEGFVLLSADYSQIELRVLAHMSGDESLLDAFKKGEDVHTITAAGIFGVDLLDVTLEQRAVGKTVNFATIYGQTAFGLSKQLKIDVHAAAGHIENYFKKYPGVGIYRDKVLASAKKNGYVETLFGRRRYFPDITSSNAMLSALAERMAFNTVFQGTAADIIKRAMIVIDAELRGVSSKTRMTLQVHDELLFEVPKTEIDKVAAFVKEKMEGAADLKAPLTVVVGTGINWAEV